MDSSEYSQEEQAIIARTAEMASRYWMIPSPLDRWKAFQQFFKVLYPDAIPVIADDDITACVPNFDLVGIALGAGLRAIDIARKGGSREDFKLYVDALNKKVAAVETQHIKVETMGIPEEGYDNFLCGFLTFFYQVKLKRMAMPPDVINSRLRENIFELARPTLMVICRDLVGYTETYEKIKVGQAPDWWDDVELEYNRILDEVAAGEAGGVPLTAEQIDSYTRSISDGIEAAGGNPTSRAFRLISKFYMILTFVNRGVLPVEIGGIEFRHLMDPIFKEMSIVTWKDVFRDEDTQES